MMDGHCFQDICKGKRDFKDQWAGPIWNISTKAHETREVFKRVLPENPLMVRQTKKKQQPQINAEIPNWDYYNNK